MKVPVSLEQKLRDSHGATLVFVALMLVVLLAFAALAVDVGYMMVTRNESQNAADAAALAGARRLGQNYYERVAPLATGVTTAAQDTAALNQVATLNLAGDNAIKQIGTWDRSARVFDSTPVTYPNAVQVEAKREAGVTNGPIRTFFAPILGVNSVNTRAIACAALSGTCDAVPGMPLGIGRSWFTNIHANNFCTQIALNDTTQSCAGWTSFSSDGTHLYQEVGGMLDDPTTIRTVHVGEDIALKGGVSSALANLVAWWDRTKTGNPPSVTTAVVVYEDFGTCINPNPRDLYAVLGFATVKITGIVTTGNSKGPVGEVVCNIAEDNRGGCFYAGTYGNIPGLVK